MEDQTHPIEDCTQLIVMGKCLERIGDHVTNIAENIYYIATGHTDRGQCDEQQSQPLIRKVLLSGDIIAIFVTIL